jgi:hypothetical protein
MIEPACALTLMHASDKDLSPLRGFGKDVRATAALLANTEMIRQLKRLHGFQRVLRAAWGFWNTSRVGPRVSRWIGNNEAGKVPKLIDSIPPPAV